MRAVETDNGHRALTSAGGVRHFAGSGIHYLNWLCNTKRLFSQTSMMVDLNLYIVRLHS